MDGFGAGWFTQSMAKTFRSWDVDQGWLLPPSVHEFVPPGHLAHFVRDTVREALDLSAILASSSAVRKGGGRGFLRLARRFEVFGFASGTMVGR